MTKKFLIGIPHGVSIWLYGWQFYGVENLLKFMKWPIFQEGYIYGDFSASTPDI